MGRPKKTVKDLPENWKESIIALSSEGASDVEIRAELHISTDLWYRLIEEDLSFSETVKEANELCKAWWMGMARKHLLYDKDGERLDPVLWYMNMKNRFGWKDREEVTVNGEVRTISDLFRTIKNDEEKHKGERQSTGRGGKASNTLH